MTPAKAPHEAIQTELFRNRFSAIAEEMGEMLQRMAMSTNVKERLDFSCALLDARGRLVVNAPHIPVHLGALGECVRSVQRALPLGPGDVVVTNHPAFGGSHLPDVTLITPIFAGQNLLGFAASRAHHAELGGIRPGSMPPQARSLAEEGVVIAPLKLVDGERAQTDELRALLTSGPHPSRAVEENLADLRAAQAANQRAVQAVLRLVGDHGAETVQQQMGRIFESAERKVKRAMAPFVGLAADAVETLDDGTEIRLALRVRDPAGEAPYVHLDFGGTSPQHPGNLNATPAIVRSAFLYVLRLAVREELPLNEGMLEGVHIDIPEGCFLNPRFHDDSHQCPAVVGGNVETSQRLVEALVGALGLMAGSQGTMNNVIFGTDAFGYYETVCGGVGAGPGFDGASAVHSHMTNTRMTDPEVLERRYPVTLERFEVRRGSGGAGETCGGDGVRRVLRFHEAVALSVLSQRRVRGAPGREGGEDGAPGRQTIERRGGGTEVLEAIASADLEPGDRLILETPGGGGWGLKRG